jgi:hypothetical protein
MHVRVDEPWHEDEVIVEIELAGCAHRDIRRLDSGDTSVTDPDGASHFAPFGKENPLRPDDKVEALRHCRPPS